MIARLAALASLTLLALSPTGARADAGADYAAKAAQEKGAVKTASGLVFLSLAEGKGPKPTAAATVKVNYEGTFIDGKVFDSSKRNGGPISFPLRRVIPCWTEGVQMIRVGGKARLVCPPGIAYGERGAPGAIPPNSTLVFEVELLEIAE
jgi:FKBP-type peptidyl-prolyl cis-trans isomerase FkpA